MPTTFMNASWWPALVWLWSLSAAVAGDDEKICPSITIMNSGERLASLHNCTVIEGHLQIILMDNSKPADFEDTYPLREITEYMVVYRVTGLINLGRMFPNLSLIRGVHTTMFPGRSLMIHDNADIREIGLFRLTNITRGSVIISQNPKLCNAATIDWGQITTAVSNDSNIINNNETRRCPGCSNSGCPEDRCWSQQPSPDRCQYGKLKNCHPLCAGGCDQYHSARHCYACTAYMHDGECIQECPPGLYGHIRSCLTEEQCRSLPVNREESTLDDLNTNYIPFENRCIDECPYGYEVTPDKMNCTICMKTRNGNCQHNCNSFKISDEILRRNDEYRLHTNCTTIRSLEIEVKFGTTEDIERRLEDYVGKVEVILDQLKIIRSYSLTSLNFFKNLYEIRGKNTVNKMALVIRGNKNLQKLWTTEDNKTREVKILNGTVSFHYNPKLCMSEIYKFGNLSTLPPFSDIEVSTISNGDQFACTVYNLVVETVKILPYSIVLRLYKPVEVDDLERFLVYFIEADKWNETIETTECEDSSWKIDDIGAKRANETNEPEHYHVITNLEPNTEYIYYVKTYTISSKTSMSKIFRSRTLPSKPSTPENLSAKPLSSSRVQLMWKPPTHPHGKLVKYVIRGFYLKDDTVALEERSYCKNQTFFGDGLLYKSTSMAIPPPVDQYCEEQCEPQKNTVNNLCNSLQHSLDIDLIPSSSHKSVFESCSNYINVFVEAKCMSMQNKDEMYLQNNVNENCTQKWSIGDEPNGLQTGPNEDYIIYEVNENYTSLNITGLKHYSQYVLTILVCREVVELEKSSTTHEDPCSQETLVSFRTLKNDQADIIDDQKVKSATYNHTVNISWEVPTLVNSVIHSFKLDYRPLDSISFETVCITMKEYITAGRSHSLNHLSFGEYEFKIRAISLAGDGPSSDMHRFYVSNYDTQDNLNLIVMILICGCILIVLVGIIIRTYLSRKLDRHNIYNIANNPGYVGIYVEDEWELAREDVLIKKMLGRGTFGTVHEGVLLPDNVPCAVKSVSKTNFMRYHAEFLNEAAIMKKFSEGYFIVKLLGVVTKTRPPLLVMELMGRGDLKNLLVKSKESNDPPPPSRYTIIRMAAQIADGMAFLEYNRFIHRDLAARNCMVANDMTVKIGDFGMSRQIYTGDYYRKGNKGEMPIRWMAPESLGEGIFTSQSDVWSYGVVIWEMMTLGEQPYMGKSNNEVMAYVLDGNLLNLPIFCPDILASIARLCWNWSAAQRPRFLKIVERLDIYLDDNFRSHSFFHNHSKDNNSPVDQSLMSPCTTYEEDIDNESINFEGGDTVAVYSAFHVDKNKMSNGHLSPM
ncbi:Fibronectin type III,Growth factor receptor cysteine-rich domain,Protein kinase, ATP binding [Cinara cedri]|uniref:receptor protein-tyrosine kinase n=1 Tax=Cinara cedri TaxID=506608 RepID=A0A5E4M3A9_9HEMI|nr:Fibronectin type III,Growth factor receptor cysteine-rich domain,Protein kinase, ATP binding [Cinara cedri]